MKKNFAIAIKAGAIAGLLIAGSASAQSELISNPSSTLPNFDVETLGPTLSELGIVWQPRATEDGKTYISANIGGQLTFLIEPTACRGPGQVNCVGMNMIALFEGKANSQTVYAFNDHYAFASSGLDPSGSAYISRYEIADYGMPRGNFATSVTVFAALAEQLRNDLFTSAQTVSLDGYSDDLSSLLLNRHALTTLTGVEAVLETDFARHQIGFEESALQIKNLIADKRTPRNKIKNF